MVLISQCAVLGQEEPQYFPPLLSRGGEGWGHDCIQRGREPGQEGRNQGSGQLDHFPPVVLGLPCLVL